MKHASTRRVFEYWNEKRGSRVAPERVDIDPVQIRYALGDTFMLAVDFVDLLRFRLAGTRVCALFGREVKGEAFGALWDAGSRKTIAEMTAAVTHDSSGVVAGLTGHAADGATVDVEMLLLPLAHAGHARIRAIGVMAPLAQPYWLGERPVMELELGSLRHLGVRPETAASLGRTPIPTTVADPLDVRVRHGFVVYSGGRANPNERAG